MNRKQALDIVCILNKVAGCPRESGRMSADILRAQLTAEHGLTDREIDDALENFTGGIECWVDKSHRSLIDIKDHDDFIETMRHNEELGL